MNTRYLKLTLAYDGTAYHGFQRQMNAITVQQVLEDRLKKIFGHELKIAGAARTDAGVHAYGQVVTFTTSGSIPTSKIPLATRAVLPADIVVGAAEEVNSDFHARFSAQSKIYVYRLYNCRLSDPFLRHYAWQILAPLDIESMHQAAQHLVGTHDFSAFRAAGGAPVNPVRTIMETACRQVGNTVELSFWGTGFLYHMVRNIVGTLVEVGHGRQSADDFAKILAGRDRSQAGATAPPQGLYLREVFY